MSYRYLITGATGFVGGHIAEACVARGDTVSAIARPQSDTGLLEHLGVTIHRGELHDPHMLHKAINNIDVVVHCAAKVGDSGPVNDYRAVNVEALRALLETCKSHALHRFVHLSTLGVYEARHHYGTGEAEPMPVRHIDGYTQTKVEAEQLALSYWQNHRLPLVILRPGFVYGPRDRTVLPKIIGRLRQGQFHYLGGDQRVLNTIYVGNLVDAVFLAVNNPQVVGQTYNLTDGDKVTKQQFIDAIVNSLGTPKPKQRLPRWLAGLLTRILKRQILRAGDTGKPWLTQAQFKFLLLNLDFSIAKARSELGYQPKIPFDQAMNKTMAWYRQIS